MATMPNRGSIIPNAKRIQVAVFKIGIVPPLLGIVAILYHPLEVLLLDMLLYMWHIECLDTFLCR